MLIITLFLSFSIPLYDDFGLRTEITALFIFKNSLATFFKSSVVISALINFIQGPFSPPEIKAFTIVPEGI